MALRELASFDNKADTSQLVSGGLWRHGDGAGLHEGVVIDQDGYTDQCIMANDDDCYLAKVLSVATEIIVGFHIRWDNFDLSGDKPFFRLQDSQGNNLVTLYRNGVTIKQTRLGGDDISPDILVATQWHFLEIRCLIADSGGVVQLRSDLTVVATFTGDTRPGTSTTIGEMRLLGDGITGNEVGVRIDNLYILDATGATPDNTYWGITEIAYSPPTVDNIINQWSGSDGDSIDNFEHLDETAVDDLDFVQSATDGQTSKFEFEDVPEIAAATVRAVQVGVRARYISVPKKLALGTEVDPNEESYSDITLTNGFADHFRNDSMQPNDTAWDFAAVNSALHSIEQRP